MKIGFLTQPGYSVLPPIGSLEIWTRELGRRLTADGHEVVIYASSVPSASDRSDDGISYRYIDHKFDRSVARLARPWFRLLPAERAFFSSAAYQLFYWRRAAQLLARDRCDVIHVYNYSQALPFVRRANQTATVVLHMQCEWLTQLSRPMLSRRLGCADVLVGCSDYITSRIALRFPEHAHRTATIYNGVALQDARTHRRPSGSVRLLHVGRISPEKGHHVLIKAFNRLVEKHPALSLTLVGEESLIPIEMAVDLFDEQTVTSLRRFYSGSYLQRLQSELSSTARKRVRFTGRLSYESTVAAYEDADIFVFPSIFEAFPIPPIEAMAAGLPVVATAVGGTAESVRDQDTGLLVEAGDVDALTAALERLITDPALRFRLGNAGRVRARELFSWDAICDAFVSAAGGRPRVAA
jgi:glycosyltransferase involved in cell wall biosynthesis